MQSCDQFSLYCRITCMSQFNKWSNKSKQNFLHMASLFKCPSHNSGKYKPFQIKVQKSIIICIKILCNFHICDINISALTVYIVTFSGCVVCTAVYICFFYLTCNAVIQEDITMNLLIGYDSTAGLFLNLTSG